VSCGPAKFKLKRSAEQYCGTAQRQFLERLLKDLNSPKGEVLSFLKDRMEAFRKRSGAKGFEGIESRITSHFAAIYAAGCLAHEYNVLYWSRSAMLRASLRCYDGVIERRARETEKKHIEIKSRLRYSWKQLKGRLVRLGKGGPRTNHPQAPGWLKKQRSGNHEIILQPSAFHRDFCGDLNKSTVIRVLGDEAILVRHKDKKPTVQRAIPGVDVARGCRYVVLDLGALEAWLSPNPS
jgi:hypothetical protein